MMDSASTSTRTSQLSVYYAPEWGSRVSRVATIGLAPDGAYAVDGVPVLMVREVGLFSVLTCAKQSAHVVLTAYLRLLHSKQHATQGAV